MSDMFGETPVFVKKSPKTDHLRKARAVKNDEFYTTLSDIETECCHYRDHFRGQWIYCNCDSPKSQFVRYFTQNFHDLGLKHVTATCYPDGIRTDYDGESLTKSQMSGDGDFSSPESISLLRQADIVVSNPPFSLFRRYVSELLASDKKFLIVGDKNGINYQGIWSGIIADRIWLGVDCRNRMKFATPHSDKLTNIGTRWFTNMRIDKKLKPLKLTCRYDPQLHPHYDNLDAIEVTRIKNLPMDWDGLMGVPITYMDKHRPDQFEIVGSNFGFVGTTKLTINGNCVYSRIIIRHKGSDCSPQGLPPQKHERSWPDSMLLQ